MTTVTDPTHDTTDPTEPTHEDAMEPLGPRAGDTHDNDPAPTGAADDGPPAGELVSIPVDALVAHPDNPRGSLGDLDELARSIRAHGVLQPLVVLPGGEDGRHLIVTGHRRHAAAVKAKVTDVPAVIRDLSASEVVEAMLIENVNRSALTTSEEVRAIERLMDLSAGKLTPAKLCKRIGRSQSWVRARMAICALAPHWREAIDNGELSLAAGEAAASVADLGPDHVQELCERFSRHHWGDHGRLAAEHRQRVEREVAYEGEVAKARRRRGVVVLTSDDDPYGCLPVEEFLDADAAKAHRKEPCHALLIERTTYGAGFERTNVCTDPERHAPVPDHDDPEVDHGDGDGIGDGATPAPFPEAPRGPDLESSHLKRKGRVARLGYAKEVWARTRGGISQAQATRFALHTLIYECSGDALGYAADILGIEDNEPWTLPDRLIDSADSPAALARVAAAVAAGIAETRMYGGYDSTPCRDWTAVLTGAGWTPDPWTAAVLDRQAERDRAAHEHDSIDQDNPAGDEVEDEVRDEVGDEALLLAAVPDAAPDAPVPVEASEVEVGETPVGATDEADAVGTLASVPDVEPAGDDAGDVPASAGSRDDPGEATG